MNAKDFAEKLNLDILVKNENELNIEGVYIGDLLSIVMSKAKKNYTWITIQTHMNIMAVAELLDLSCIIVVEDMEVEEDALIKADELNITVFKTKESAYEVACKLCKLGIK
ncbi:MAG: serine kinase [Bacillota bacterium]|jgi:serine kinase of HPr protein (carbohydrate metabolism regulator)|nr:serine kinase [Bacillota bacterium]